MRYAMIPLTSTVMNIKTESDFLSSKHLIEEAVRQGRGYFYFCLCEDHKKYLGIRNTPGITYLYNPERTEFYYQSSFVPTNFIELFNPVLGRYYVDGVITSRSGAAAIMSKLLWDKRVEEPEIPVIVIENKVSAIGGTHNVMCYEDLILRASGYAVSCNFFATERERKLALEMCREFLSPSALKRVIENSHVVYHGVNCDEIEGVGKRTPKAEKFTLLYSGRLTSNKQWKKVLLDYKKFFSFGRDLDLVVCAPLGSTEVDRALKILGTWGEVNLGLPRKEYLEKLVSSHVCLSNSLEEGGTVGFVEQLMSGAVVILPRRPWVEGLLGPMYKDYPFLYDGTTEEAYTVLKAVYEDYQSAREKMEPIRRFIRENYDIKVVTKRYFDIIEEYIFERKRRVLRKREPKGIRKLIDNILRIMGKEVNFLEFLERTKLYSEKDVKGAEKNWRSGFPSRWQMYQFLVKRGYRDNYLFENPILMREKNGEPSKDKRVLSKKAEGDGVILHDKRIADGKVQEHDLPSQF
jgi:glycosyltransferase involved in cell wall biosynthesis